MDAFIIYAKEFMLESYATGQNVERIRYGNCCFNPSVMAMGTKVAQKMVGPQGKTHSKDVNVFAVTALNDIDGLSDDGGVTHVKHSVFYIVTLLVLGCQAVKNHGDVTFIGSNCAHFLNVGITRAACYAWNYKHYFFLLIFNKGVFLSRWLVKIYKYDVADFTECVSTLNLTVYVGSFEIDSSKSALQS